MAEKESGCKLRKFLSDNDSEYTSDDFKRYLSENRIKQQFTAPGTAQPNGTAERMSRTLMYMTRAMLVYNNVPVYLWAEALATSRDILNTVSSPRTGLSPHQKWYGKQPTVSHFKIFGSTCSTHLLPEHQNELEPKTVNGIFVGYAAGQRGYRIFLPEQRKIIVTRDVIFAETEDQLLTLERRANRLQCADRNAHYQQVQIPSFGGGDVERLFKLLESGSLGICSEESHFGFPAQNDKGKGKSIAFSPPSSPSSSDSSEDSSEELEVGKSFWHPTRGIREAHQFQNEVISDEVGKDGTQSENAITSAQVHDTSHVELEPAELYLALATGTPVYQEAAQHSAWKDVMQEESELLIRSGTNEFTRAATRKKGSSNPVGVQKQDKIRRHPNR